LECQNGVDPWISAITAVAASAEDIKQMLQESANIYDVEKDQKGRPVNLLVNHT
jgi:hypothetical protein